MNYCYASSSAPVIKALTESISSHLTKGESVLWLLSGGSGAAVCIEVSKALRNIDTSHLFITMSDERYGPVEHTNENIQQLLNNGFEIGKATLYRPLRGLDRSSTAVLFSEWLTHTIQSVDFSIALLGIGPDGHTSGIKPQSIAVSSTEAAVDFRGDDFERITTTIPFLQKLDEIVVQSFGDTKHAVVASLLNKVMTIDEQPAKFITNHLNATLYSDYKEETV